MSLSPFGLHIIYADLWNLFLSWFHLFVIPFLYHVWSMKNYIFFMNHMVSPSIIHHSCCWLQDEEVMGTKASEKLKLFNHKLFHAWWWWWLVGSSRCRWPSHNVHINHSSVLWLPPVFSSPAICSWGSAWRDRGLLEFRRGPRGRSSSGSRRFGFEARQSTFSVL